MERWQGRVALVTGASAGIGAALCKALVQSGMKVIGAARGVQQIQAIANSLKGEKGSLMAVKCDLTKDEDIYALFNKAKEVYGGVDMCINNAGLSFNNSLLDGTPEEWRHMTDVNIIALCLCTKLAVASMKERGIDDGHIINISSLSGHRVVPKFETHFYAGTKHAVRALTEGVRQELRAVSSHIRVSSVSPGYVVTEFVSRMLQDDEKVNQIYNSMECIRSEDIAAIVLHIIGSPPHVEINDMLIRPTEQNL